MSSFATAREEYQLALRQAKKDFRARQEAGLNPYLTVLDDILENVTIASQENLGLVNLPLENIAGTKTGGRHQAFSATYLPLLSAPSEFSDKWCTLYAAHLSEGIRDPIKAFEFMNRFYVQEGNKRVSVLSHCQAATIPANVTRLIPEWQDTPAIRIYYEFMEFYKLSKINYVEFSREGSYARLQNLLCKAADEPWTDEDRLNFLSFHTLFRSQFEALGGDKLNVTVGDAILVYLTVYRYAQACEHTKAQLLENLRKIWNEVKVLMQEEAIQVSLHPDEDSSSEQTLLQSLLPLIAPRTAPLKVMFLHDRSPETSAWTAGHSEGRKALEAAFPGQVKTMFVENVDPGIYDEAELEAAVIAGADVIFTTSPQMMPACLKVAARYPHVKVLNCSLNQPHPTVRTYSCRIYEAKYLMGMLAGILTPGPVVGYVANYPVYGVCAGINAFAMGLRAVRPEGRVLLRWQCQPEDGPLDFSDRPDITIISGRDQKDPNKRPAVYYHGLRRRLADGSLEELAVPIWHWGSVYENIVRSILNGSWDTAKFEQDKAISYWWGMSAGAVDIRYNENLPDGTLHLLHLVEQHIRQGEYDPFVGRVVAQGGVLIKAAGNVFTAEDLFPMNWLAENVDGVIAEPENSSPEVRAFLELQGIKPRISPQQGGQP